MGFSFLFSSSSFLLFDCFLVSLPTGLMTVSSSSSCCFVRATGICYSSARIICCSSWSLSFPILHHILQNTCRSFVLLCMFFCFFLFSCFPLSFDGLACFGVLVQAGSSTKPHHILQNTCRLFCFALFVLLFLFSCFPLFFMVWLVLLCSRTG